MHNTHANSCNKWAILNNPTNEYSMTYDDCSTDIKKIQDTKSLFISWLQPQHLLLTAGDTVTACAAMFCLPQKFEFLF
jgi:hypothetical protein